MEEILNLLKTSKYSSHCIVIYSDESGLLAAGHLETDEPTIVFNSIDELKKILDVNKA